MTDGDDLPSEPPGQGADRVRCKAGGVAPRNVGDLAGRTLGQTRRVPQRVLRPRFGIAQKLIGRDPQRLAHLMDQREVWFDLRALVARVAVLLDAKRSGKMA